MTRPTATALMACAAGCWGVAAVTTKVALAQLAATDLFLIEVVIGTLVVWTVLIARRRARLPRAWPSFVALGLLEPGLSFVLFDIGLSRTSAADGAILLASESLIAALLAWALLGERLTQTVAVALAAGMTGSVLVTLGRSGHGTSLLGDLLVLAAATTAAVYGVGARRRFADSPPLAGTAVQLLAAAAVAVPIGLVVAASGHSRLAQVDAGHLAAAIGTGVFGAAIPFLLFNLAIRHVTVVGSALTTNLVPLIATGLAVAVLGERPGPLQLVGGLLVVAAAAASDS